jgi:anti-sigma28 factor (negative regulator of flagellin synthesis)
MRIENGQLTVDNEGHNWSVIPATNAHRRCASVSLRIDNGQLTVDNEGHNWSVIPATYAHRRCASVSLRIDNGRLTVDNEKAMNIVLMVRANAL